MNLSTPSLAGGPADMPAFFCRLEDLLHHCRNGEANKHAQVAALIDACIDAGINTGPWIIGTVSSMGFNTRHVGKILHDNKDERWRRDADRRYTNGPN